MEPAELPTWATEETAAPVEPVIIHAAPGEKDAAIASASQSSTEDSPKRSWLWAGTLAIWGLITQVAKWWWGLAKDKPVAGAIMLIIVIIAIAVRRSTQTPPTSPLSSPFSRSTHSSRVFFFGLDNVFFFALYTHNTQRFRTGTLLLPLNTLLDRVHHW